MALINASGTIGTSVGSINSNWTTTSVANLAEIKGTPIYAQIEKSLLDLQDHPHTELGIKMELCDLLIKELFKANVIEFTREDNPSWSSILFRARIFVTPKDQTQLLRVNKAIP